MISWYSDPLNSNETKGEINRLGSIHIVLVGVDQNHIFFLIEISWFWSSFCPSIIRAGSPGKT